MHHKLFECGIYAFVNERKKQVYVGQTNRTFLIRYLEHLKEIEIGKTRKSKLKLLKEKDTRFFIIKEISHTEDEVIFLKAEKFYMNQFQDSGYTLISKPSYFKSLEGFNIDDLDFLHTPNKSNQGSYKKLFVHICISISKYYSYAPDVFIENCLQDVQDKFSELERNKGKQKTIRTMYLEEYEYIILKLFKTYKNIVLI